MSRRARRIGVLALGAALLCGALAAWRWARTLSDATPDGAGPELPVAPQGPTPTGSSSSAGSGGSAALAQRVSPPGRTPTAAAKDPRAVASFGWGAGRDELGRDRPQEGNPEAPMSLVPAGRGALFVLDQVNQRALRVDASGRVTGTVPLPVQAAQDLAVAPDGTLLVLDRLVDKTVGLVGPDGSPRGELPVLGRGISEGGAVTGVFADGDDVYVEREHGDLVRIGTTRGQPDAERPELPGRPTRDGSGLVTAHRLSSAEVSLTFIERATRSHRYTRRYALDADIGAIVLLDSDRAGLVYLGALVRTAPGPGGAMAEATTVLCIDGRDGRVAGRVDLPANTDPDETFRELAVPDEGGVLFLHRTEAGAQLLRAPCSPVVPTP